MNPKREEKKRPTIQEILASDSYSDDDPLRSDDSFDNDIPI